MPGLTLCVSNYNLMLESSANSLAFLGEMPFKKLGSGAAVMNGKLKTS